MRKVPCKLAWQVYRARSESVFSPFDSWYPPASSCFHAREGVQGHVKTRAVVTPWIGHPTGCLRGGLQGTLELAALTMKVLNFMKSHLKLGKSSRGQPGWCSNAEPKNVQQHAIDGTPSATGHYCKCDEQRRLGTSGTLHNPSSIIPNSRHRASDWLYLRYQHCL